ncbi:MAG: pole-organizing protein PopZ [Hyphobacterium sp.]|nr:MAG: pole-organizing protein PopZ [Hyphobacterium sp.]
MSTEAAENEPSMEEILASIRRIIDEDEEGGETEAAAEEVVEAPEPEAAVAPEPAPEPAPAPEPEVEDEVLELTDKIDEPTGGTDPLAIDDDLMIVDREEDEPVVELPEPEPEPEPAPEPVAAVAPEPEPEASAEELVSPPAATAAAGAFDALAENLRVASADGMTFEGMVREMMRPMLKEWLDANLPRIVEEKVESEIERIARRR